MALNTQFNNLSNIRRVKLKGRKRVGQLGETLAISIVQMVQFPAKYNNTLIGGQMGGKMGQPELEA